MSTHIERSSFLDIRDFSWKKVAFNSQKDLFLLLLSFNQSDCFLLVTFMTRVEEVRKTPESSNMQMNMNIEMKNLKYHKESFSILQFSRHRRTCHYL